MTKVNLDRLRDVLSYDRETGVFSWKVRASNKIKIGDRAGSIGTNGRRFILVDGVKYSAHQLAWFYETGEWSSQDIKQLDGNYDNCSFSNLKPQSRLESARQRGALSTNTTGFRGVSPYAGGKFQSSVTANYQQVNLGVFDTAQEASAEYELAMSDLAAANTPSSCNEALDRIIQRRRKRVAWLRLVRSTRRHSWTSFEEFCVDIGRMDDDEASVAAKDEAQPIGNGNFRFLVKVQGEFDRTTKEGRAAYMRAYREANPDRYRHAHITSNYGIDDVEYERMKAAQDGKCLICEEVPEERLAVDHNHGTKAVRGLLCKQCNYALGQFGDNVKLLRGAVKYLERFEVNNVLPFEPTRNDRDWLHVATLGFGT